MKKNIIVNIGTYHIIVNTDEVPFLDELENTQVGISIKDNSYSIFRAPNMDVASKIDKLLTEDFRNKHNSFILKDLNYEEKYENNMIRKSFKFDNGYYLEFHNTNDGYKFTIYNEHKDFVNGGTINFYEEQKQDDESIIKDIADFTCYKFLLGDKQEIDAIDFENIKI